MAKLTESFGQPSWRVFNGSTEAFVTRTGGHIAPVTFDLRGRKIAPYSVAPWFKEAAPAGLPAMLRVLRGDFFCMPFGGNEERVGGEQHPPHGDTANYDWAVENSERGSDASMLHLGMKTRTRRGRVDKIVLLKAGHDAVYTQHVVSGMTGRMDFGHHAMLKFPEGEGSGLVSTCDLAFGQVYPGAFERAENKGYSALKAGAVFKSLEKVPRSDGTVADLSRYPARRGYEDLVMLVPRVPQDFGWTAVSFPEAGYVWFALRDLRVLRSTIFWMSNGGRHYAPWNGRHVNVMGIEDVTGYFHDGLASSVRANSLSRRGIATCAALSLKRPLVVNYIAGVAAIGKKFDHVRQIKAAGDGKSVTLTSRSGAKVTAAVDVNFIFEKSMI